MFLGDVRNEKAVITLQTWFYYLGKIKFSTGPHKDSWKVFIGRLYKSKGCEKNNKRPNWLRQTHTHTHTHIHTHTWKYTLPCQVNEHNLKPWFLYFLSSGQGCMFTVTVRCPGFFNIKPTSQFWLQSQMKLQIFYPKHIYMETDSVFLNFFDVPNYY